MNELVKVETHDNQMWVDARELHEFLGAGKHFSTWIKDKIAQADLIENVDYLFLPEIGENSIGRPSKEYQLTIDTAKHIAMLERNEQGKKIRRYFIEVEKQHKANPLAQLDPNHPNTKILLSLFQTQLAQQELESRQKEHEDRLKKLEVHRDINTGFYAVMAYAKLKEVKLHISDLATLGRKASKLSKEIGVNVGKTPDPRFGTVNIYHQDVLEEIFEKEGLINDN